MISRANLNLDQPDIIEETIKALETGNNSILEDLEYGGEAEEFYYQYYDAMSAFSGVAEEEVNKLKDCLQQKQEHAQYVLGQLGIKGT